jgi:hypothetical protein
MPTLSKPCGETEIKPIEDEPLDFIEPWWCDECGEYMYNKDQEGYPSPGAPIGLSVKFDKKEKRVCLLCAEMYIAVLKNPFMLQQHREWVTENKHKDKLKFGQNYLDNK